MFEETNIKRTLISAEEALENSRRARQRKIIEQMEKVAESIYEASTNGLEYIFFNDMDEALYPEVKAELESKGYTVKLKKNSNGLRTLDSISWDL